MAISTPLPADLTAMLHTIRTIRSEQRYAAHQLDSLVVREGRAIERERLAAMSGYHRYEEGGCDGNE